VLAAREARLDGMPDVVVPRHDVLRAVVFERAGPNQVKVFL